MVTVFSKNIPSTLPDLNLDKNNLKHVLDLPCFLQYCDPCFYDKSENILYYFYFSSSNYYFGSL